jgi:thermitase
LGFHLGVNDADAQEVHRAAARAGVTTLDVRPIATARAGQNALSAVTLASGVTSIERAIQVYRADPRVLFAEPDYVIRVTDTPNDTYFAQYQWNMTKIGMPAAWTLTHGSGSIYIAILDCGIFDETSPFTATDGLRGHPDLRGKVVASTSFVSSPYGTHDACGHGSHVAGIASALTNNATGVAGVGWDTRLLNVKVMDDTGAGTSTTLVSGLNWAVSHGAKVINLSLGALGTCPAAVQSAIDSAWASEVVVVAAAGNQGTTTPSWPGDCNHVLAVAATDQSDARASFSNYGSWVQVAAPGTTIMSTYSDSTSYGYRQLDGTSMASPHVAGLAALLWMSVYGSSAGAVINRIMATADPVAGTGTLWQSGRINAAAAVSPAPPVITAISPTSGPPGGGTQVTLTGTDFSTLPGATVVKFGSNVASGVSCASALSCTAISPAGGSTVYVTATVAGKTSLETAAGLFTYVIPTVNPGTYEDTNTALSFSGSWTIFTDPLNSGGTAKFSGQTGSGVSLTFNGGAVTLTYLKQFNAGIATVSIDGTVVDQLDTYNPTRLYQQQKTYIVAAGVHTVTVTVSGNKNVASSGAFVLFDAFIVAANAPPPPPTPGPGTYEDTNAAVSFSGTWTTFADSGNSGGSAKFSNQTGAAVSLTFDGGALTLVHLKQANAGIATVSIDGTVVDQLDTYNPTQIMQQQKTYTLAAGVHTVTVTVSGNKNAASSGAFVLFDAFIVAANAPPPPPGPGTYEDTNTALSFSGSWTMFTDPLNSGGTAKFSGQTGSGVSLTFNGGAVTLTYLKQFNAGIATVSIDGTVVDQLDTYNPTRLYQQQKTYIVAAGVHTVTVTVSGNKNAASSGAFVLFDAFIVGP